MDAIHREAHGGEVSGVVLVATKLFDGFIAAHVPPDLRYAFEHDLGDGRCPRTAADDGNRPGKGTRGALFVVGPAESKKGTKTGHETEFER